MALMSSPKVSFLQRRASCLLLLLFGATAVAQESSSSFADIEPAVTTVPETAAAGAALQEGERLQLTDEVVDRVASDEATAEYAEYFAFPNSSVSSARLAKRAAAAPCKTFPGDPDWPKDIIWDIFDLLLGGALIPTVPLAAPCYDTPWGKKDTAKCAKLLSNWTNPLLQ